MPGTRRLFLPILLILIGPAAAPALDHVVLQLKWRHQFQFAGYYAAIEKGFYRDAGLEVELREARPGHDPAEEVLDGKAQFGVGTSNIVLLRAQGKPVVILAVIYQHSPFVLLSPTSSGLRDIHALAGRPIMMEPDAAELLAYFKNEGVDPSRLKLLPHSFNALDLGNNAAGSMSAYSTDEPYLLRQAGIEYMVFTPRAGGIDFYGDNLFTTEEQVREHPARVRAFLQASLRGWEYAMKHREEIVDLILRDYNRGKSREQLLFEAEETAALVHPELIELGYINPGRWQNIARTYAELGMIPENVPLDGFIYQRESTLDLRIVYWGAGVIAVAALGAFGWSFVEARLNRQLRREIEARRRAEEIARQENTAKARFLAILAHEVRAPLSGILSSLWLFRQSDCEEEKNEVIDIAETSANNLLRMVDNMLDHSKLEAGHMEVERIPVNLPRFLDEICDLFRASAAARGIELHLAIGDSVPPIVETDPTRLRQILSNLLSNAIKFTARGAVRLTVAARPPLLFLAVADAGPGISVEQRARIFEPYVQGDATVTRHYGGTGLGLSISLQLARLLGGGITVESVPGQGATFTLSIALHPAGEKKS